MREKFCTAVIYITRGNDYCRSSLISQFACNLLLRDLRAKLCSFTKNIEKPNRKATVITNFKFPDCDKT